MGEALDIGGLKGVLLDALSLQTMQFAYGGLKAIDHLPRQHSGSW